MLQNILNNTKKQDWMRACANKKINKWEFLDYVNEPVYFSPTNPVIAKVRNCKKCGIEFNVKVVEDRCYLKPACRCGKDGTHLMTLEKLETMLSPEEAKEFYSRVSLEKRKGLANTVEYWVAKGLSVQEAVIRVKETQTSRSSRSPAAQKGARFTNRTTEHWIKKGFTAEEAVAKVKETQTHNGEDWYIRKYGEVEGTKKFNARIEQWLNAPGNKNMTRGRSQLSIELFDSLGYPGYYGENEKTVRGTKKVHRVDYMYSDKIIEYFGDYWHGNPLKYAPEDMVRKKKVEDIWSHDSKKINDLIAKGLRVMLIWEHDYKTNKEATIQQCKEFLNGN